MHEGEARGALMCTRVRREEHYCARGRGARSIDVHEGEARVALLCTRVRREEHY